MMLVKTKDELSDLAAVYLNISLIVHLMEYIYEYLTRFRIDQNARIELQLIVVLFICFRIIKNGKIRVNSFVIMTSMIWVFIISFSYFLFNPADYLVKEIVIEGFSHIIVPVYLISLISDIDKFVKALKKFMPLVILYCLMQFIYKTDNYNEYFIFTYSILPTALFLIAYERKEATIKYKIVCAFIFMSLLLFGTRSALLCIGIELCILSCFFLNLKEKMFAVLSLLMVIIPIYFFYDDIVFAFVQVFPGARISSFLSGQQVDNSRSIIWAELLARVLECPFVVRGVLSDRLILSSLWGYFEPAQIRAWYAHNFVVEILYGFGILGFLILIVFFSKLYRAYRLCRKDKSNNSVIIFATFTSYFIGKLSVSSSYLFDISTGYIIGVLYILFKHGCKS